MSGCGHELRATGATTYVRAMAGVLPRASGGEPLRAGCGGHNPAAFMRAEASRLLPQRNKADLQRTAPPRCPTSSKTERASVSRGIPLGLFWDFWLHQPARA